jgi:hypothetical protein
LVEFSNYVVGERAPYLGETRLTVGGSTWKGLYRLAIEALIGREVLTNRRRGTGGGAVGSMRPPLSLPRLLQVLLEEGPHPPAVGFTVGEVGVAVAGSLQQP